ncbi:MAG: aldo/keto reductase [Anaerolineae bacterium]|nr:aldo/keto reductase [Anaerolineae bacterium]
MRYKLLGKTGLRVSELCLGAMIFGDDRRFGASAEESRKIFDAFVEAGGNFIDTANYYAKGMSERLIGDFVQQDRDRFVIATKYTLTQRADDPNGGGNHRKSMVQSVEASLKQLNVEYIDLYWLHAWDFLTPVEEIMRGLDDLVRAGKILYVGVSDTPAWIIAQANTLATLRGWTPFVGLQVEYNLVQRDVERDLLPMAQAFEMAVTCWSPLGGGLLSGKYNANRSEGGRFGNQADEQKLALVNGVIQIAEEIGHTPAQVALAWLRSQPGNIIPIIGSRRLDQFQENLGCLDVHLTDEQRNKLSALSQPQLGFPHDFLASDGVRKLIYGNTFNLIDQSKTRM